MSADEIRELLELKGWSIEFLAVKLEVSAAAVYSWLSQSRNPSTRVVRKMKGWLEEAREKAEPA